MKVSGFFMDDVSNYFTVTPMSQRISLEPGQTYVGSIKIANPATATEDFAYKVQVAPYGVIGEEYTADLVTQNGQTQIVGWMTIDEPAGVVKPNSVKEINFTIDVPETAPAGGQYAAILVSQDTSGDVEDNNVAVKDIFEIASLIYADVSGEIVHKGEILENNIPGFVADAPIVLSTLISNGGNVHETATIIIEASDFFTGDVIVVVDDAKDYYTELVMPETTRYIERNINDGLPLLGVVHVEQTIYYNGGFSQASGNVIICPIWFIVLVGVGVAMLVAIIVRMVKKYRKKKS